MIFFSVASLSCLLSLSFVLSPSPSLRIDSFSSSLFIQLSSLNCCRFPPHFHGIRSPRLPCPRAPLPITCSWVASPTARRSWLAPSSSFRRTARSACGCVRSDRRWHRGCDSAALVWDDWAAAAGMAGGAAASAAAADRRNRGADYWR